MPPITVILIAAAALLVAFGFILHITWLFIAAAVVVLLGLIGGVTSSG